MSWQVKDEISEINNVKENINKIRDQLFINSNSANLPSSTIVGGASGNQAPLGAGSWVGLQSFQTDNNVTITDIDLITGLPTFSWDRLHLTSSSMVVAQALLGSDIKWIEGALSDGQYIMIKPKSGDTITLIQGGNIYIPASIILSDDAFVIAIFYEDQTSPDNEGNWIVHKFGGGGAGASFYQTIQDEGVARPQQPILDFRGAGVTAVNGIGTTVVDIPGASGFQTPWLQDVSAAGFFLFNVPRIEYNVAGTSFIEDIGLGQHAEVPAGDVFEWDIAGGIVDMALIPGGLELNVNLDMNLNYIKFQAIGIPPPPAGLEKRFLFCDSADFDKLKARSSTGIIDLEGLVTNMGNLNNSQITVDLNFVNGSGATMDYDAANISLSATGGFQTLPGNPVGFINIKLGGTSYKMPYYLP